MNKEYLPYNLAIELKELGFNEMCHYAWCNLGGWNKYKKSILRDINFKHMTSVAIFVGSIFITLALKDIFDILKQIKDKL
jgi:hypothetical protein